MYLVCVSRRRLPWLALLTLLIAACARDAPEQQIRDAMAQMQKAVEAGSVRQIDRYLALAYRDKVHSDRRSALASLFAYLRRYRSINLFLRVQSLVVSADATRAETHLFVAMAGVPLESVETLIALRADLYRFEVTWELSADAEWQVVEANWQRAAISDLSAG